MKTTLRNFNHFDISGNQELVNTLIELFDYRDIEFIEALEIESDTHFKILEEYKYKPNLDNQDGREDIKNWMKSMNKKHGHKPGEKYIYYRIIRLPF